MNTAVEIFSPSSRLLGDQMIGSVVDYIPQGMFKFRFRDKMGNMARSPEPGVMINTTTLTGLPSTDIIPTPSLKRGLMWGKKMKSHYRFRLWITTVATNATVLIAFLLFGSIVYPETTVAAPAITGVSGTLGARSQVTVTGSGFGSKSQAAPWLYDDFDSGASNRTSIVGRASPTGGRAWSYYDMSGGGGPTLYDNSQAYNGSYSVTESNAGNGNNAWVGGMGMQKRYVSYRLRWHGNASGVMKIDRTSSGTQQGNANPPYDACPNFGWGNTEGGYINNCDAFLEWLGWPLSPPDMAPDTWHRIETYFEIGSRGVANGTLMIWVDNVLYSNYRNSVVTCGNSAAVCQIDTWIMLLTANGGTLQSWTDDVYIDSTLQRVEICDAPTWASRTHCEIQIPGAWTDSSVTVSSRLANFSAGSTVYVYVADANGTVNATGFAVQMNALTTPSAPTGLGIVK